MSTSKSHTNMKAKVDRPIILIHGFLGTPSDWNPFRTAWQSEMGAGASTCVTIDLLDVARRITLDHRQIAGSEIGSNSTQTIGLKELASKILADIDADDRMRSGFDVIGYSMGGRIALEMAIQRGNAETLRDAGAPMFVLLSAHPGLDDEKERAVRSSSDIRLADRLATISAAKENRSRLELTTAFLDEWYGQALFSTLRTRKDFIELAERRRNDLSSGDSGSMWAEIVVGCSPGRSQSRWEALELRTDDCSMIVGDRDARYVAVATRARSIGVLTALICDAGHAAHIEQPAQLAAHLIQLRLDCVRSSLQDCSTP
ncbi:MAG: alpha/beta fold hydrolase [Planctomycetota bacterium]|nr:alpha/beta fold hydrolase [Planctomycetota bacterium]